MIAATLALAHANVTSWLGLLLYWLPLAFCTLGYFVRTWHDVQKDHAARSAHETRSPGDHTPTYLPSITIGTLLGRGLVSICPVANLCAAIFDVAPDVFRGFFRWLGRVFDQPLVPKRKESR